MILPRRQSPISRHFWGRLTAFRSDGDRNSETRAPHPEIPMRDWNCPTKFLLRNCREWLPSKILVALYFCDNRVFMKLYTLDPLLDPRWAELITSHPDASAFHTRGWLKALANTYGFRPVALTSVAPGAKLLDGVVLCEVRSWLTGPRLVSLPFSDHAQPLFRKKGDASELQSWFEAACSRDGWKYAELRPVSWESTPDSTFVPSRCFWLHALDLRLSLERLFANLHKDCLQRRIRHAEREHFVYRRCCSSQLLPDFYKLLIATRRRHRLLPQPRSWFTNLLAEMNPNAEIRLVRKNDVPVAAILTLRHRETVIYKYGCSDEQFHSLAGMPFLLWRLIEESKAEGAQQIDLGRTDLDNLGLIRFKDRLGSTRGKITYLRYPGSQKLSRTPSLQAAPAAGLLAHLPPAVSSGMGKLLYRHFA